MKHGVICLLMACAGLVASCASLDQLMAIEVNTKNQSYWDKEKFMEEYALSEAEYIRWKKEVLGALSDPQSVDPLIAESKQVVYQTIRVEIPSQEEIIGTREAGKIILTDMAMYRIYKRQVSASSYDKGCHRVNYESLAVGVLNRSSGSRGFDSESWTYADFLNIGKIASEKLETILTEKQEKKLAGERKIKNAKQAENEARQTAEKMAEEERIAALLIWDDGEAKIRAKAMKGKTIVFKSLYLGMPIETAFHILYKEMKDGSVSVYSRVLNGSEVLRGFQAAMDQETIIRVMKGSENLYVVAVSYTAQGAKLAGLLTATPEGSVTKIMLDGSIIGELFDSSDLDGEHFVKQFRSAYKVPPMESALASDSLRVEWSCTTKDGDKLTIDTEKTLILEKVASQTERKQAFD